VVVGSIACGETAKPLIGRAAARRQWLLTVALGVNSLRKLILIQG
jgi:hypothetical protein